MKLLIFNSFKSYLDPRTMKKASIKDLDDLRLKKIKQKKFFQRLNHFDVVWSQRRTRQQQQWESKPNEKWKKNFFLFISSTQRSQRRKVSKSSERSQFQFNLFNRRLKHEIGSFISALNEIGGLHPARSFLLLPTTEWSAVTKTRPTSNSTPSWRFTWLSYSTPPLVATSSSSSTFLFHFESSKRFRFS